MMMMMMSRAVRSGGGGGKNVVGDGGGGGRMIVRPKEQCRDKGDGNRILNNFEHIYDSFVLWFVVSGWMINLLDFMQNCYQSISLLSND